MNIPKVLIAATALCAAMGANAAVNGSLGGGDGAFVDVSSAGLSGGTLATLTGGTVYTADQPFADIPSRTALGAAFLAAGPTSGTFATLTFGGTGVDYVSFLWGSPDMYNLLTVTSTGGASQTFSTATLGFSVSNGDQRISQYVQFSGIAGSKITSLGFTNLTQQDAFETSNYSVTTPVPEPETYALVLAGLGAVGFVARRRRSRQVAAR